MPELTVHILWQGTVLCGSLHGVPRAWGNVARWVGANDPRWRDHATCPTCREQAELFEQRTRSEPGLKATWSDCLTPSISRDGTWTAAR